MAEKKKNEEANEIIKQAQKIAEEQHRKDKDEFMKIINEWLKEHDYALDYQVIFFNTNNGSRYSVAMNLVKQGGQNA